MERSLVLNATYEPLGIVSGRRAAVLVLAEKADALHDSGAALRAERVTVPVPSVIRLRTFVRVPYRRRAALSRRAVFLRDGGSCQYCGTKADSIDHVVPAARAAPTRGRTSSPPADAATPSSATGCSRTRRCGCVAGHALGAPGVGDPGPRDVPSDWAPYLGTVAARSA
ncbi:MAG: HNH endonuclease [Acidimicrobiales bacterium]